MTDLSQTAAAPEPGIPISLPPPVAFESLDTRVLKLWRLTHLIVSAILLGGGLIAVVLIGLTTELWRWLWSAWILLALLRVWLWIWYLPKAYRAWGYHIDGKVLETRHGVWFRVVELLPLSRLQHVDLHTGPLERSFGLSSLLLHTAGTHQATITLPGLESATAERLRDQLVARGGDDGV